MRKSIFLLPFLLLACQTAPPQAQMPDGGKISDSADARPDAAPGSDARPDASVMPDAPGRDAAIMPDAPPPQCTGPTCPSDGNPCTQDLCVNGACVYSPQPDGLSCHVAATGADGRCYAGECCTGCWNGSTCVTGTSLSVCGSGGHACQNCDDGNDCTNDTCNPVANACYHSNADPGTACSNGTCGSGVYDGVCQMAAGPVCGGNGQACCSGSTCTESGTSCDLATSKCEVCGAQDELACLVNGVESCPADPTHLQPVTDPAHPDREYCRCGGAGEPCCNSAINPCNAPLQCNMGTCYQP